MNPHALVIDADVMHCACEKTANSRACLQCLDAIYDGAMDVVITDAIRAEWLRHRSDFSKKWLNRMYGRKRVLRVDGGQVEALRTAIDDALENSAKTTATKDEHLVDAALDADKRILSMDDKAGRIFSRLARNCSVICDVHWTNPRFDGCGDWLADGAPDRKAWQLSSHAVLGPKQRQKRAKSR
jgi:N-acetylglucosamine-6-phosphate deacetylase